MHFAMLSVGVGTNACVGACRRFAPLPHARRGMRAMHGDEWGEETDARLMLHCRSTDACCTAVCAGARAGGQTSPGVVAAHGAGVAGVRGCAAPRPPAAGDARPEPGRHDQSSQPDDDTTPVLHAAVDNARGVQQARGLVRRSRPPRWTVRQARETRRRRCTCPLLSASPGACAPHLPSVCLLCADLLRGCSGGVCGWFRSGNKATCSGSGRSSALPTSPTSGAKAAYAA